MGSSGSQGTKRSLKGESAEYDLPEEVPDREKNKQHVVDAGRTSAGEDTQLHEASRAEEGKSGETRWEARGGQKGDP